MLFQAFAFALFMLVTVPGVFVMRGTAQKVWLLAASLFFYAYGSPLHLLLFLYVILVTYGFARWMAAARQRWILALGIVSALTPLLLYKYVPFLLSQFAANPGPLAARWMALPLPIGISFYTFQAVGYLVDVWRGEQRAEKNLVHYALFLSFFPQLVAGPIERSRDLLPQLRQRHIFDAENCVVGLRWMGIGFFLKVFVADTLAYVVNIAYDSAATASALFLLLATALFGMQIYCDFHGYSLIARGCAKVLGIDLMRNFEQPYLATSMAAFWRRWHISLSGWFKSYVYIPLGGNRRGKTRRCLNQLITFLCSGIWHGANWTFALWGALHGLALVAEEGLGLRRPNKKKLAAVGGWLYTQATVCLLWVPFRANSLADALLILRRVCLDAPMEAWRLMSGALSAASLIPRNGIFLWHLGLGLCGAVAAWAYDAMTRARGDLAPRMGAFHPVLRWAITFLLLFFPLCLGKFGSASQFIYFRF
ncbi:MAG: MBOAT family protein [Oscillospiraceae bacterium]|jgi:D-alanyl-lipoteichoic acid acyltransferase DltB (MBOAT superfamily)|nr:MBOAT family protein [Oscillospiraceae bacterium]